MNDINPFNSAAFKRMCAGKKMLEEAMLITYPGPTGRGGDRHGGGCALYWLIEDDQGRRSIFLSGPPDEWNAVGGSVMNSQTEAFSEALKNASEWDASPNAVHYPMYQIVGELIRGPMYPIMAGNPHDPWEVREVPDPQ